MALVFGLSIGSGGVAVLHETLYLRLVLLSKNAVYLNYSHVSLLRRFVGCHCR